MPCIADLKLFKNGDDNCYKFDFPVACKRSMVNVKFLKPYYICSKYKRVPLIGEDEADRFKHLFKAVVGYYRYEDENGTNRADLRFAF